MTKKQKVNVSIVIGIVALSIGVASDNAICPDKYTNAIRAGITFFVLSIFEWWYVLKLIKEFDEPKPDWYPLKIIFAIIIALFLLALINGNRSGSVPRYDPYDEDPQFSPF